MADGEGVSDSRQRTGTDWNMIGHSTNGSNATSTGTRILTLGSNTSSGFRAVSVHQTLWLTAFIRISPEIWQTLTIRSIVSLETIRVSSTR